MNKRRLCILLACVILFTAFIPFSGSGDVTLYASDGRTIIVPQKDAELWTKVGWCY